MSARRRYTRRRRRQQRMRVYSRGKFRVNHKSKTGRTGGVFAKRLRSRRHKKTTDAHVTVTPTSDNGLVALAADVAFVRQAWAAIAAKRDGVAS